MRKSRQWSNCYQILRVFTRFKTSSGFITKVDISLWPFKSISYKCLQMWFDWEKNTFERKTAVDDFAKKVVYVTCREMVISAKVDRISINRHISNNKCKRTKFIKTRHDYTSKTATKYRFATHFVTYCFITSVLVALHWARYEKKTEKAGKEEQKKKRSWNEEKRFGKERRRLDFTHILHVCGMFSITSCVFSYWLQNERERRTRLLNKLTNGLYDDGMRLNALLCYM